MESVGLVIIGVLTLAAQVFIIVTLMRVHEISANVDRLVVLLAAIANKQGVTQGDIKKAWGLEKGESAPAESASEASSEEAKKKKKDKKS